MQNDEVLAAYIEAQLIIDFMDQQGGRWTGRHSELLSGMRDLAEEQKIEEKLLPKSPNALSRKLNTLKPNLEEVGISITTQKGGQRLVTITKVPKNIASLADDATTEPVLEITQGDIDEYVKNTAEIPPSDEPPLSAYEGDEGETGDIFKDFSEQS